MKPAHLSVVVITACALVAPFVRAQESAQVFTAPVVIGTGVQSFRLAYDMNGDGDQDALSVWFQGPGGMIVSGLRNDGTGKLVPGWATPSLPLVFNPPPNIGTIIPSYFAKGDFNADGSDDFVFALDKQVGWWISNGDSVAPSVPWVVQLPSQPVDLAVADFTADGVPDVVILLQSEVRIYATQPASAPTLLASFPFTPADATRVVALELTGSGGPDLAILRLQSGSIEIHPVVGGVIQPGTGYAFGPVFTSATLAGGDIDGDGDADVVFSINMGSAQVSIYVLRRTGPGAFNLEAAQVAAQAVNAPRSVGLFDLDTDGDLDLVSVSGVSGVFGSGSPMVNFLDGFACLRRNDGSGAFGPLETWSLSGASGDFGVADLDGDGDQDMVAGRCVSYGMPGAFPPPQLPVEPIGIGGTADVDRDGDPDLGPGVPGVDLNGASVPGTAVNDGNGGFATGASAAPPAPAGTSWCGPGFAGDFDGDGAVDLLVEHLSGATPSSAFEMRLLRNVGGGSLVDGGPATAIGQTMRSVPIQGGSFPTTPMAVLDWHSVIVADLDGDSDLDVVTLYPRVGGSYSVTQGSKVWLNGGSGFFTPGQDMPAIYPSACAELTGDGIVDLVGMRQNIPSFLTDLVVMPGLGGGAFGPPIVLYSGMPNVTSQNQVVAVDWDHDGDTDLVAAISGLIVRFTNTGGFGPFPPSTTIAALDYVNTTTRLAVGDVDGDGLFDVVANPFDSQWTRVWLGASSGPLVSPITYSAGMGSLADVDGDGDLDFLSGGFTVPVAPLGYPRGALYRNRTVSPPQSGLRLQYGAGLAGSGGYVPVLGSAGVLRVGFSGEVRLSNALGGAQAYLGLGFASASVPAVGGTLLIAIDSLFPFPVSGPAGTAGAGFGAIPWTLPPGLGGVQIFEQAATLDPAAPQGFALTQGVKAIIGF